jgi:hypothetical protein
MFVVKEVAVEQDFPLLIIILPLLCHRPLRRVIALMEQYVIIIIINYKF